MMQPEGILFDIDGVLLNWKKAIPGAAEALHYLDERRIPYQLVTNATRRSRATVCAALNEAGLAVPEELILTPMATAAHMIRKEGWNPHYLVVDEVAADLPPFDRARPIDAVLVGDIGEKFNFQVLNEAFQHLKNGAVLMAAHKNRFWLKEKRFALDAGPFVAALEYGAEVEAMVIGKPSQAFFDAACEHLFAGRKPSEPAPPPARSVVMIGDRWNSDVEGARAAGLTGLLVRTGTYEAGDEKKGNPDGVLDSIADLPGWLEGE